MVAPIAEIAIADAMNRGDGDPAVRRAPPSQGDALDRMLRKSFGGPSPIDPMMEVAPDANPPHGRRRASALAAPAMSFIVGAVLAGSVGGVAYLAGRTRDQHVAPSERAQVRVARVASSPAPDATTIHRDGGAARGEEEPTTSDVTISAGVDAVDHPDAAVAAGVVSGTPVPPRAAVVDASDRDIGSPRAATPDVTGAWELSNTVVETRDPALRGAAVGYHVTLQREGTQLSGRGEKTIRDNRVLPPHWRTPVRVTGVLENGHVVLRIVENSRRRKTTGTYRLQMSPDGSQLLGSFESDLADARGTTVGRRLVAEPARTRASRR